jgi:hypothetical protein
MDFHRQALCYPLNPNKCKHTIDINSITNEMHKTINYPKQKLPNYKILIHRCSIKKNSALCWFTTYIHNILNKIGLLF